MSAPSSPFLGEPVRRPTWTPNWEVRASPEGGHTFVNKATGEVRRAMSLKSPTSSAASSPTASPAPPASAAAPSPAVDGAVLTLE
jgi:hypothetical protein